MVKDSGMFLRLDYTMDEDGELKLEQYFSCPDEMFFPEIDFENNFPEMIIIREGLEEQTGLRVFYGINPDSGKTTADEVMLCSVSDPEDEGREYLEYLYTPIGTFEILCLQDTPDGKVAECDPLELTTEIKDSLWLKPCMIDGDMQHCYVSYVGKSAAVPFPPQKPEAYLVGSEAWEVAKEYWEKYGNDDDDSNDGGPFIDEGTGIAFFTNQAALKNYLANKGYEEDIPAGIAYVPIPIFRDYVIRAT